MIEAVGKYSEQIKGIVTEISASKQVELRLAGDLSAFEDGKKYLITAEIEAVYDKINGATYRAKVLSAVEVEATEPEYAHYKGVFRINEGAGGILEKQGGELQFYRGDAFNDEMHQVQLTQISGWVTVAVPKAVSSYLYRAGDLVYVDGKLYHKNREVGGAKNYEICVRAEICHKVDGTEYWERVRAAHFRASQRKASK
jgi:hypothetical protein